LSTSCYQTYHTIRKFWNFYLINYVITDYKYILTAMLSVSMHCNYNVFSEQSCRAYVLWFLLLPNLEVKFRDLKQADNYVFHPPPRQHQVSELSIALKLSIKVQLLSPKTRKRCVTECLSVLSLSKCDSIAFYIK
jgi:hypothetical protein